MKRKIKITGEAYFEVARNPGMPFIVQHKDVRISVLGTYFNVNTYEDEAAERITLLEGSVRVSKSNGAVIIETGVSRPVIGHNEHNDIKVLNNADTNEVMAWKEWQIQVW